MPIVRIEVKRSWPGEIRRRLIDTTHEAMMQVLKIPEHDKLIRYVEHKADDFISPPGTSDNYILVEISLFPGRSLDAKRRLYQELVRRYGELGIAPGDTRIVLYESALDNWGVRGGIPASEVNLGFSVNV